jgi:hypothetical protein
MFSSTRSNLLRQLPDRNEIILRLTEIVTVSMGIAIKSAIPNFKRFYGIK